MSIRAKLTSRTAVAILLALVLVVGIGNLWATRSEVQSSQAAQKREQAAQQAAQRRAGQLVEAAICTDLGTMARIPPPAGSAAQNPSRAYEQAESRAWRGLYGGLGCTRIGDKT